MTPDFEKFLFILGGFFTGVFITSIVVLGVYLRLKAQAKRVHKTISLAEKQIRETTAGRAAQREINNKLATYSKQITRKQIEHLSTFTAAYLELTNIPPRDAELIQEIIDGSKVRWYFQKKNS